MITPKVAGNERIKAEALYSRTTLDKNRYWNVDDSFWYEELEEQFKDDMKEIGISVDDVNYSGFGHQGDGASFSGVVSDFPRFLKVVGIDDPLFHEHCNGHATIRFNQGNWYSHSTNMSMSMHLQTAEYYQDFYGIDNGPQQFLDVHCPYDDVVRRAVWLSHMGKYDFSELEDQFLEFARGKADEYFARLEEEYDWLTSDEVVAESLLFNDFPPDNDNG